MLSNTTRKTSAGSCWGHICDSHKSHNSCVVAVDSNFPERVSLFVSYVVMSAAASCCFFVHSASRVTVWTLLQMFSCCVFDSVQRRSVSSDEVLPTGHCSFRDFSVDSKFTGACAWPLTSTTGCTLDKIMLKLYFALVSHLGQLMFLLLFTLSPIVMFYSPFSVWVHVRRRRSRVELTVWILDLYRFYKYTLGAVWHYLLSVSARCHPGFILVD